MRAYAVFYLIGWVLAVLAATMLLPIAFALKLDSIAIVQAFVVPALAIGFLGGILILAFRDRSVFTGRWESLLLLGPRLVGRTAGRGLAVLHCGVSERRAGGIIRGNIWIYDNRRNCLARSV